MKPKAKTIIERHGFKDHDRNDSKHDEIQIWVYNNFLQVLKGAFPERKFDQFVDPDLRLEFPIIGHQVNHIIGFIDVFSCGFSIAIEIKSKIQSVGELIRQIQFYRTYLSGPTWLVVSPDDRAKDILTSQGIYFFKYKAPDQLF